MPVIAPPRKATSNAGPMPRVAACAVRTLARTETFMPMKPQAPDRTAPTTKPIALRPSRNIADQYGKHHANHGDGLVLPCQIGCCTGLNGRSNLLHARIASVLRKYPAACPDAVDHGNQIHMTSARISAELPVIVSLLVLFREGGATQCSATAALLPLSSSRKLTMERLANARTVP